LIYSDAKNFGNGHVDKKFDGEISDAAVTLTRVAIRQQFKFYPEKVKMQEAITSACHNNKRDPVLDYFASLKWDGTPRLAKMLTNYLGAPDTPLNEAISVKVMCAIVRRAKSPGCKYDQELVVQGAQSIRKSTFCEDLAVAPDLYTDAGDLGAAIKDQIDVTQGKQIIEFPERAGHSDRARDRNKASLSRKVDRARLSYAHYATDAPRRWVPIATCNPGGIYSDPTGERRYWHVAASSYDRDGFLAAKDQLYAEAVALEPDEKLYLDTDELRAAHDVVVTGAKEDNELVDVLSDLKGEIWNLVGVKREERVSTAEVRWKLGMQPSDALRSHDPGRRIAEAMMTLGWTKALGNIRCHKGDQSTTGYTRPLPDDPQEAHAQPGDLGAEATQAMNATDVTGDTTFDQKLAQGIAQAQADLAHVRGTS
jgi:Virulence-associated protein E